VAEPHVGICADAHGVGASPAACALGAEALQMGTRMVSAAESPVHQNWKDAIVAAKETDTVFLNRQGPGPALRALRTERTTRLELEPPPNIMGEMANILDLYFGGVLEAAIPLTGQVAGRIDSVKPVAQIIRETIDEFEAVMTELGARYGRTPAPVCRLSVSARPAGCGPSRCRWRRRGRRRGRRPRRAGARRPL
jgi:enoyl-[acyl-carrier protein] reductase II